MNNSLPDKIKEIKEIASCLYSDGGQSIVPYPIAMKFGVTLACCISAIYFGNDPRLMFSSKKLPRGLFKKKLATVKKISPSEAVAFLKNKKGQSFPSSFYFFTSKCEWCKCFSSGLHKHHYPVRKEDGGLETVEICSNCHAEFHRMVDYGLEIVILTKEAVEMMDEFVLKNYDELKENYK